MQEQCFVRCQLIADHQILPKNSHQRTHDWLGGSGTSGAGQEPQPHWQSFRKYHHYRKRIAIQKGKTITKKEVFELKDYFDRLSGGKETILIEDFIESFSQ